MAPHLANAHNPDGDPIRLPAQRVRPPSRPFQKSSFLYSDHNDFRFLGAFQKFVLIKQQSLSPPRPPERRPWRTF
jgi:hypothetical protein